MSDDCLFCRIAAGEIPSQRVFEDEEIVAFRDIAPQAPVHVLVIPKGPYVNFDHFANEASAEEIADFTRTAGQICRAMNIAPGDGDAGYRTISNAGDHGVQEVPHYHLHILGGRVLGRMLKRAD